MNPNLDNCLVVMVDIQERLLPVMDKKEEVLKNMEILLKGVKTLALPLIVNEQYKQGLGETVPSLQKILGDYTGFEKTTFSCCRNDFTLEEIQKKGKEYAIVFGIETHICVLQTALDLKNRGYKVFVVEDCVSSRKENDKKVAMDRMIQAGIVPTTYESFLFEVLASAKHEKFKEISKLIK
ncbi:MAG: hydrolase [Campylobacterales bacterium]|nr:hydrolase [Campylobacterales bacterium]